MAFLKRQYSWVSIFVAVLAVLISTLTEWGYPWGSIAFVGGALFSSLAGFIGIEKAVMAGLMPFIYSELLKIALAIFAVYLLIKKN